MVQTSNSKEAAKAVAGKHNPLVAGSNPAGPISNPQTDYRRFHSSHLRFHSL